MQCTSSPSVQLALADPQWDKAEKARAAAAAAAASEQGGGGELRVKTGDRVPPWATSPHLLLPTSPTHLSVAAAQLILLLLLLPGVQ